VVNSYILRTGITKPKELIVYIVLFYCWNGCLYYKHDWNTLPSRTSSVSTVTYQQASAFKLGTRDIYRQSHILISNCKSLPLLHATRIPVTFCRLWTYVENSWPNVVEHSITYSVC